MIGGGKVDAWGQLLGGFYVTRYDAKGALQWTSTCKSAGGNADVAMDPTNGDGIVGGSYYYVECGDTTAGASVDSDVFVSRLAAADGSGVRTALFKSSFNAYARTLATDAEGNALIGGRVDTGLEVGTTQIHDQDMFVAKLASNGFVLWAKDLGIGHVLALATDARGDIAVLANCRPLEPPTYALAAFADPGLCVAKLSGADGTLLWARSFGVASTGENQDFGHTIAVSSNGDVAIAGTAQNLILDGQQVTEAGFVTVLEGTSGLARWVGSFDFSKPKISFSKQDMLAVAANFGPGTVDFGTGALTTKSGETDSVVFLIAP